MKHRLLTLTIALLLVGPSAPAAQAQVQGYPAGWTDYLLPCSQEGIGCEYLPAPVLQQLHDENVYAMTYCSNEAGEYVGCEPPAPGELAWEQANGY